MRDLVWQIISVFETGKAQGAYDTCVVLPDHAGITFGRHQTTDASDGLDRVVYRYIDLGGVYGDKLRPFLDELDNDLTTQLKNTALPEWCLNLISWLRVSAQKDPMMKQAQDEVFASMYWEPAVTMCKEMGLKSPLAHAVIYDTCVHSGPGGVTKIRKLFPEVPPVRGGDEREWVTAYVRARRAWLASFQGKSPAHTSLVRKTVYRMDAFLELIKLGNWDLATPFVVRGQTIK